MADAEGLDYKDVAAIVRGALVIYQLLIIHTLNNVFYVDIVYPGQSPYLYWISHKLVSNKNCSKSTKVGTT